MYYPQERARATKLQLPYCHQNTEIIDDILCDTPLEDPCAGEYNDLRNDHKTAETYSGTGSSVDGFITSVECLDESKVTPSIPTTDALRKWISPHYPMPHLYCNANRPNFKRIIQISTKSSTTNSNDDDDDEASPGSIPEDITTSSLVTASADDVSLSNWLAKDMIASYSNMTDRPKSCNTPAKSGTAEDLTNPSQKHNSCNAPAMTGSDLTYPYWKYKAENDDNTVDLEQITESDYSGQIMEVGNNKEFLNNNTLLIPTPPHFLDNASIIPAPLITEDLEDDRSISPLIPNFSITLPQDSSILQTDVNDETYITMDDITCNPVLDTVLSQGVSLDEDLESSIGKNQSSDQYLLNSTVAVNDGYIKFPGPNPATKEKQQHTVNAHTQPSILPQQSSMKLPDTDIDKNQSDQYLLNSMVDVNDGYIKRPSPNYGTKQHMVTQLGIITKQSSVKLPDTDIGKNQSDQYMLNSMVVVNDGYIKFPGPNPATKEKQHMVIAHTQPSILPKSSSEKLPDTDEHLADTIRFENQFPTDIHTQQVSINGTQQRSDDVVTGSESCRDAAPSSCADLEEMEPPRVDTPLTTPDHNAYLAFEELALLVPNNTIN